MPSQRDESLIPTVQAWGYSSDKRLWIGGNNVNARREVELLLADPDKPATGELDLALITPLSTDEAVYFARKLRGRLIPNAAIWIVCPKRGSPREAEFTGNLDEMMIALFELGYSEVGRASLSDDYTSNGFRKESEPFNP